MFHRIVAPVGVVVFLFLGWLVIRSFPESSEAASANWTGAILYGYGLLTLGMSAYALIAIGLDKWIAVRNERRRATGKGQVWRVSETSLHLLALLGGWPGSWLGQERFRHKTSKTSFRAIFWGIVWMHACVVLALLLGVNGYVGSAVIAAVVGVGGLLIVGAIVQFKR